MDDNVKRNSMRFSPSLCLTHNCNLNCVYCYQEHDKHSKMTIKTACECIDWIFDNIPSEMSGVEIGFIGGEPLLEFELIKQVVEYVCSKNVKHNFIFYATTNGTILTNEMKKWFIEHRKCFVLALSIDGAKDTHDYNRDHSFDKIDFEFFLENYPDQSVKMTLSEYSLPRLAENIKFIHSLGFKNIGGVNLSEGEFDWSKDKYLKILIPQLQELVRFYVNNNELPLNQMFDKKLNLCESTKKERKKWCGIGDSAIFFDVDGRMYPCPFITPMTFSLNEIEDISKIDFTDNNEFIDVDCINNCYIYPICPTCLAANYLNTKNFKKRDKRRCKIQKLIALFIAQLNAERIIKNQDAFDKETLYYTIEAIKKIRTKYLSEFSHLLE